MKIREGFVAVLCTPIESKRLTRDARARISWSGLISLIGEVESTLRSPRGSSFEMGGGQLCRLLVPFVLVSLLFSSRAMASNPQDLGFQLRFS